MIRIRITKDNEQIKKITFYGHANYDDYGKDIVCSAVSAIMLCTVNAILSIDKYSIEIIRSNNKQVIDVLKSDDIIIKLIDNMIRCLENLESQYPKNIEIK